LLSTPAAYAEHWGAVYALGTAIEVQAQALVAAGKKPEALRLLEASAKARAQAPYALRARIQKRWNLIGLVGEPAPPIHADEWIGAPAAWVEQLHGQPTVLFFWAEGCGDCKAQAAAFRRIVDRFAPRGVQFAAPTRFYTEDHAAEKKRAELVWRDVYGAPPQVAVPDSEAAMLLYGVSSTPTLVLVDRQGRVRLYSPTRMSEERLAREIEKLLR
jgi:thiol-disulfide isomerase/thioredoxin